MESVGGILRTARRLNTPSIPTKDSQSIPSWISKPRWGNTLVHWGKLQLWVSPWHDRLRSISCGNSESHTVHGCVRLYLSISHTSWSTYPTRREMKFCIAKASFHWQRSSLFKTAHHRMAITGALSKWPPQFILKVVRPQDGSMLLFRWWPSHQVLACGHHFQVNSRGFSYCVADSCIVKQTLCPKPCLLSH